MSPSSSHGGYTAPVTRESCFGSPVTIANGGVGTITWDGSNGPDTLLSRAVLGTPTAVTAGVYFVAAYVGASALTAGGSFRVTLELDQANDDVLGRQGANAPQVVATVAQAYYLAAGGAIRVQVINNDGAAPRDFSLVVGLVQRLS